MRRFVYSLPIVINKEEIGVARSTPVTARKNNTEF